MIIQKRVVVIPEELVPAQAYPFFKVIAEIEKIVREENNVC